jgi:hypothetical protein
MAPAGQGGFACGDQRIVVHADAKDLESTLAAERIVTGKQDRIRKRKSPKPLMPTVGDS